MATLGPKRPDGAGGQWSEEKPVRRRNPETGVYEKTGATKTIWKVSRTEPWTHTDESGHLRSGSKVIVAEGADLARAYANLERRLRSFREQQNPVAPMREQKVTLTLSEYFWDIGPRAAGSRPTPATLRADTLPACDCTCSLSWGASA